MENENMDLIGEFFDNETEEEKRIRQQSLDQTTVSAPVITVSGTYRMAVETMVYFNKKKNKVECSPRLTRTKDGSKIMLYMTLSVVDGTPQQPKGSIISTNIILSQKNATPEDVDKINRMLKPRIVALTGQDQIFIEPKWIQEWLLISYEEKDGKYIVTQDHKMKKEVMVVIEDSWYEAEKRETVNVRGIFPASPGQASVSNSKGPESAKEGGPKPPSSSENPHITNEGAANAPSNETAAPAAATSAADIADEDLEDY